MEKVKLIQGNQDRADEIRKTLEDWNGINKYNFSCNIEENYYYVDPLLSICRWIDEEIAKELISEGKAEIYELPEKQYKIKPFDKVLVRNNNLSVWKADLFSHMNEDGLYITITEAYYECIPYCGNEYLIGTSITPK